MMKSLARTTGKVSNRDLMIVQEPDMEEFFLPLSELLPDVDVSMLEKAMFNLNMVSRDEFDSSQYDLDQFEAHFEEIEDHHECLICRYYRTCTFYPQPPAGPHNSQFSGRCSPVNIVLLFF